MARWRDIKHNKGTKLDQTTSTDSSMPTPLMLRFKAFIVDSFMITMPIMYFVVYMVMGSGDNFSQNKLFGWSIILALHAVVILGFLIIKKETPGMRAYELKLVHIDNDKKVNLFQIFLRYIFTLLSSITIFGFIPFFRKDKKTFQDLISFSYIIVDDKRSTK